MDTTIGFIGIGNMGGPMARNLLRAGYTLRVFDVDRTKANALAGEGAVAVVSPAATVEPGGVVFSMVPDDAALRAIVSGEGGLLERIGVGGVHVSCSTISPALARQLAALYAEQESSFIAATVSGRPDVAAAAQLSTLFAGPAAAKARVLPLLRAAGNPERLYDLGEQQAAAAGGKLALNHLIAAIILALADSAALAEQCGIPPAQFIGMVRHSPLFAGSVFAYGDMIAADEYTPALFPVALGEKDARLMVETADVVGMALPASERLIRYLRRATERGWAGDDWAVAARVIREEAGLHAAPLQEEVVNW